MKIYILKEQVMNGTVTVDIMVSGIQANSFKEAIEALKKVIAKNAKIKLDNIIENDNKFSYNMGGDFPIYGHLEKEPMKILNEN